MLLALDRAKVGIEFTVQNYKQHNFAPSEREQLVKYYMRQMFPLTEGGLDESYT